MIYSGSGTFLSFGAKFEMMNVFATCTAAVSGE